MKKLFLLLSLVIYAQAIMTITPVNIGDEPGTSGMLKGSFETQRGNSDVDSYSAGLRVQYDSNATYLLWSDLSFSYGKSDGNTNTNKSYAHARYLHTVLDKKWINAEAFVQAETNEFTKVNHRFLGGAGVRFYRSIEPYGELYLGVGGFYEDIAYTTTEDPQERNVRLNTYFSYTKRFNKQTRISYVTYLQPKMDDFDDIVSTHTLELNILVYQQLYLNFVLYYDYDAKPAHNVKDTDFSQKTSFIYKF